MNITGNIHALKLYFRINAVPGVVVDRSVYVFLIFQKDITLIDTGVSAGREDIFNYIREHGRDPGEIGKVFLTHSHPDHIGALKFIKEKAGCSVFMHEQGRAWTEDTELQAVERPVPGFRGLVSGSCRVDGVLRDGDVISAGENMTIRVVHTPGHSPDSLSFYCEEDRVLISGDLILKKGDMPVYDDHFRLKASLEKIRSIGFDILLSSWSDPVKGDEAGAMIEESIAYLEHIDDIVMSITGGRIPDDGMVFCSEVVKAAGLPPACVNPIVMRSFLSHLERR